MSTQTKSILTPGHSAAPPPDSASILKQPLSSSSMPAYHHIINHSKILDHFGRWPSFHDAEILHVILDRKSPSCEMIIHAWLMTNQLDSQGYYVLEKHALITFQFEQLLSSEFLRFNHQNCLFSLDIEEELFENKPALRIHFPTSSGLEGSLLCTRALVTHLTPCNKHGQLE